MKKLDIYVGIGSTSCADLVLHVRLPHGDLRFTLNELVDNGEIARNLTKYGNASAKAERAKYNEEDDHAE